MESESRQRYRVRITEPAAKQLRKLARKLGGTLFQQVSDAIRALEHQPERNTQQLSGELAAYRSLHVNRCRVIVKIIDLTVTVYVVAAGWHTSGDRDDVYETFKRTLNRRGDAIQAENPGESSGDESSGGP